MIELEDIILIIIAVQSLTTAIGLFFIYSTQSRVNEEIIKRNYKLAEKNSLYNFNEKIINFLKALVPFYYFIIGINIIKDSGDFKKTVDKAIASGKYEPIDFENRKKVVVEEKHEEIKEEKVEFDIVKEPFKARKNDSSIYNPLETPVEYIEKIINIENAKATPFLENNNVINNSNIIKIEDENIKNSTKMKEEISNYISNLSYEELEELQNTISKQALLKRTKTIRNINSKDVA